jgi:hypothetical protein
MSVSSSSPSEGGVAAQRSTASGHAKLASGARALCRDQRQATPSEMAGATTTVKSLASLRLAGRRSPNLAGAIYGTIVATAVVAGVDEKNTVSPARAFWILVASGVFFWAAHVYAYLLADRLHGRHRMKREDVSRVMSREWPLLQASFPLAVPLALGSLGIIDGDSALGLATLVGVASLVAWGVLFSRREGHGLVGIVGAATANAAVGLFIIGIKLAVT